MKIKLFFSLSLFLLSACTSQPVIPQSPVIPKLSLQQQDQKSFAIGYQTILQTYQGQIDHNYPVRNFNQGVADWFAGRYPQGVKQLKQDLYGKGIGYDKTVFSYYSGVIFAAELNQNLAYLGCFSLVDIPSLRQGIGEGLQDLQQGKVRENDPYLDQGADLMLSACQMNKNK